MLNGVLMKKLIILPLLLIYWGCEEPNEKDTTPPTVTITSPLSGSTIHEVITITCMSSDNIDVEKVELWINGISMGLIDETEPYSFVWNTTKIEDGTYTIIMRAYDTSGNTKDSEPIILIVDNTISIPQSLDITHIVFQNGSFYIKWQKSPDEDFESYYLKKSVSPNMDESELVYSTIDINDTTFIDNNVDPLIIQYYQITAIDTFNFESKGEIVSSSLDPVPDPIDVISVSYTLDEMLITWEESTNGDFKSYLLLTSETELGEKEELIVYTDKTVTNHSLTNFDPTIENWFWVQVYDTLNQVAIGNGATHMLDTPPLSCELDSIIYENNNFEFSWSSNEDEDFASYNILVSSSAEMVNSYIIYTSVNQQTNNIELSIDPWIVQYYQIIIEDVWGLQSESNIVIGDSRAWFFNTFGGEGSDWAKDGKLTADGGFILTGLTSLNNQSGDLLLLKLDSKGNTEWYRTFGDAGTEGGISVQETFDGGFVAVGWSDSYGNNKILVVKTDNNGYEEWIKIIGVGEEWAEGHTIKQSYDGGYVIMGINNDGLVLIKLDNQGTEEWSRTFSGNYLSNIQGNSLLLHTDGGFIILGIMFDDSELTSYIFKLNSDGYEVWNQPIIDFWARGIEKSMDGGFVIVGNSEYLENNQTDFMVVKLDGLANIEWTSTFGGFETEIGKGITQSLDGGFVITGYIGSNNGDVALLKIDATGNPIWNRTVGGSDYDYGHSINVTEDDGYFITGSISSYGYGSEDVLILKTDPEGNIVHYGD